MELNRSRWISMTKQAHSWASFRTAWGGAGGICKKGIAQARPKDTLLDPKSPVCASAPPTWKQLLHHPLKHITEHIWGRWRMDGPSKSNSKQMRKIPALFHLEKSVLSFCYHSIMKVMYHTHTHELPPAWNSINFLPPHQNGASHHSDRLSVLVVSSAGDRKLEPFQRVTCILWHAIFWISEQSPGWKKKHTLK